MVLSSGMQNEKDILSDNSVTLASECGKCHDLKVSLCSVFVIPLSLTSVYQCIKVCLFGESQTMRMPALRSGKPAFSSWARKKKEEVNKLIKQISEIFREGITARERTWMPLRGLLQNVCLSVPNTCQWRQHPTLRFHCRHLATSWWSDAYFHLKWKSNNISGGNISLKEITKNVDAWQAETFG